MKKYLITGSSGFVGKHFVSYLDKKEAKSSVLGIDLHSSVATTKYRNVDYRFERIDMLNKNILEKIVLAYNPDYIIHLASFSSVGFSWLTPIKCFLNNTNVFLNLLDIIRENGIKCRILSVGSSEEYGNVNKKHFPLKESHTLSPISPYAVARVSQELLSKVYVEGYNLDIILTRSFNHIGPGQKEPFVIASFIKQLIEAKNAGKKTIELVTGDVSIVRDFLDVRDVVVAYDLLLSKGRRGEIYNVCSGRGYSLSEIIEILSLKLRLKVNINVDKKKVRPKDNKIIVGSNDKIRKHIQWIPRITLERSLEDAIDYNSQINAANCDMSNNQRTKI